MPIIDEPSVFASEGDVPAPSTEVIATTVVAVVIVEEREPVVLSDTDALRRFVDRALDGVDELADAIAYSLGLRDL
ncbi:MAG TPA: hypothetical protein VGM50_05670 [Gemmatimonadaceae bacterium]|jgi:hypothetical protein